MYVFGEMDMDKLDFYTVNEDYVKFLQDAESEKRGFSRVPNMAYSENKAAPPAP